MKAVYNKSKIMLNAWYMFRVKMVKNFAEALRKAWNNEKLANIRAMIEGRTPEEASVPEAAGEHSAAAKNSFRGGMPGLLCRCAAGTVFRRLRITI